MSIDRIHAFIALGIAFSLVIILSFSDVFPPIIFLNQDSIVYTMNIKNDHILTFYQGVVDAYANLIGGSLLCRSTNIYVMVRDVISNMNSSLSDKFYLILNREHIRGYYNGKFYEYTCYDCVFYKNSTKIIRCTLFKDKNQYIPICNVVYDSGKYLPEADVIELINKLFNESKN